MILHLHVLQETDNIEDKRKFNFNNWKKVNS